jgi:hypothetical protein
VDFTHRHRYAKPKRAPQSTHIEVYSPDEVLFAGARWNLRTTQKGPRCNGFLPGPDGALLRIVDSKLLSVRAAQRDVEVPYFPDPSQVVRVGHRLVGSRDHRAPYVVVDSRTGVEEGSLQEQRPLVFNTLAIYKYPPAQVDGDVLWINEVSRIAAYDVTRRALVATLELPDEARFIGAARLASGSIAAIVRPAARYATIDRSEDRVACFDARGVERWSVALAPMHIAAVGPWIVCVDDARGAFVVFDDHGERAQSLPMFEPSKTPSATVLPLPSGREFIAIGGHGEWDHYADASV